MKKTVKASGMGLLMLALGVGWLALCSRIQVPMVPVPMTLQSFGVLLLGLLLGPGRGVVVVLLWLALAAAGLPLLVAGTGGLGPFLGPTVGYLAAFPLAVVMMGRAQRGTFGQCLLAGVAAHGVILLLGWGVLARTWGAVAAFEQGVQPFVPGAVAKSAAAAGVAWLVWRWRRYRGATV